MKIRFAPLLAAALLALPLARAGHFFSAEGVDLGVLPPPPAAGSVAARADLETILQVQRERTPADVAWAQAVEKENLFLAPPPLGSWFTADHVPVTARLLHQAFQDGHAVSNRAKDLFARARPPRIDPRVQACVTVPPTSSYPSGHATAAFVWAGVLIDILPERRADLMAWAHRYAWARIQGGVHYPTDDVGGQILAEAVLRELRKSPAYRAAVEQARAELQPFLLPKAA